MRLVKLFATGAEPTQLDRPETTRSDLSGPVQPRPTRQVAAHLASPQAGRCALRYGSGGRRATLCSNHCDSHRPGLRSHRHGIARTQRTIRGCAWQCDEQGADVHENAGVGCSVRLEQKLGRSPISSVTLRPLTRRTSVAETNGNCVLTNSQTIRVLCVR